MNLMYDFNVGYKQSSQVWVACMRLYQTEMHDAAKQLAEAVGTADEERFRKLILALKAAQNGNTLYCRKKSYGDALEVFWQANKDGDGRWYGPRTEAQLYCPVLDHVVRRIKTAGREIEKFPRREEITPLWLLRALEKDKPTCVKYSGDFYDTWYFSQPENLDAAPRQQEG